MDTLDKFNQEDQEVLALVNKNYARARRESIEREQEERLRQTKIKYQTRPKNKQRDFVKKAIIGIVATATVLGVGSKMIDIAKDNVARNEFVNIVADHVNDNVVYTNTLSSDGNGYTWYYDDVRKIAQETLNENKDIDIDTRIYGTYLGLNDYQRDEYMDKIMHELQDIVTENPLDYTEEEVRACNHTNFTDYLASLGMEKDDYIRFMRDVTLAYGQNDIEKVQELLTKLNGGGR